MLERNLRRVQADLRAACADAGRDAADVRVVAVTKSVPPETAHALFALGQRDLGESRLEGLEQKHAHFERLGARARWHFVGHLQRNKAARVVRLADEIHSVDSLVLLAAIDRHAAEADRKPAIYLQVLLSDEESKHGFEPRELVDAVDAAADLDHVELVGLMTLAPLLADEVEKRAAARRVFEELAGLALDQPALAFRDGEPLLSMGMSGDFREAVAAGAHVVRIGSALFEGLADG